VQELVDPIVQLRPRECDLADMILGFDLERFIFGHPRASLIRLFDTHANNMLT
jgi:hypothetical protein